jgi:hypothetical protein
VFDTAHADFSRLDPQAMRDRFSRPEHVDEGMTFLAGERPLPFANSTLFQLSLAARGTDAVAVAQEEAAQVTAAFAAVVDEQLAACPERGALVKAAADHEKGLAELTAAEEALAQAEAELAAAIDRAENPKGLRKPVEAAREAVGDCRAWVERLAGIARGAANDLERKRAALLKDLVATEVRRVDERRAALRDKARSAITTLGRELLAVDALAKALGTTKR